MALGAVVGTLCMKLVAALGAPPLVAGMVGVVTGIGAFASLLWLTEPLTYLLYMCDDIVATDQFAHRQRPDWDDAHGGLRRLRRRCGARKRRRRGDHRRPQSPARSSPSTCSIARSPAIPALGRHRPRLRLLTIGANLPIVGFHPEAQWFRDRLRRLALAPDLDWVDYQSRHDIMNFWPFDPVAGHGIVLGPERRNPLVVAISFRDLWIPGDFGRRRWRFFKAHFQFLMANERLGAAYDYYLICCGPLDLVSRATKPEEAIAAMAAA